MDPDPALPALQSVTDIDQLATSLIELSITYGARILGAFAVLLIAWIGAGWLARWTARALDRTQTDGTVASFLATLVRWSLRIIGLVLCLGVFGIEATSLAAVLGGAGVAIGIALKGNLSNLASGLLLLAFRPFKDGDWIEVDGRNGRVAQLGLMQTELDTFDNARHWIPNTRLIEGGLTNYEHHPWRRMDLEVGVAYDTDLREATRVLQAVLDRLNEADSGREPILRAEGFGSSSIDFRLGIWVPSKEYLGCMHELVCQVKEALDEAEIEIPFPQRDLHLRDAVALPVRTPVAAK